MRPPRVVWMLWALTALTAIGFPVAWSGLPEAALPVLDVRPGFTAAEVDAWMQALGQSGRATLLRWHYYGLDAIFPVLFGASTACLLVLLGNRLPRFARLAPLLKFVFAAVLVAPAALLDYAQNFAIIRILHADIPVDPGLVAVASSLNAAKFAAFAIPLCVIVMFVLARLRHTKRNREGT